MNIIELSTLIQDERKCEEYLRKVGILKTFTNCVRCGSDKLGIIRRNRYKCYKCKAEWSIYRNSFLATVNIEISKFIMAIKLFELEKSTYIVEKELNISQKTVAKIYSYIRNCVVGEIPDLIKSRIIKNNIPLFLITSENNLINIKVSSDDIDEKQAFIIGKRRTDSGKNVYYDFTCKYKSDLKIYATSHKNYSIVINSFWSYAIERLYSFKGTTEENYYSYLKELELRYNNRNADFFEVLFTRIASK